MILNGIMPKACVVEFQGMTKSGYLGKAREGLILIMPQMFSLFFFSFKFLLNDVCGPVCFSDCLVSDCSKEIFGQLMVGVLY